jgi:site-specific recombinase XerD
VEQFLDSRRAMGYAAYLTSRAMQPMLVYLRRIEVLPPEAAPPPIGPLEAALDRYRRYLTVERGLGSASARVYIDAVRPFLRDRISADGLQLNIQDLRAAEVTRFIVANCPRQGRGTAKLTVTALRSLLGFLHVEGLIGQPLAKGVPSVAGWRLATLPKALNPDQVQRLLASCDRRTRTGSRDFAILTVLVRLGLRSGEAASLQLDHIDWRAGQIVVHGKGNRAEALPLPRDVGEAIAGYVRRSRPVSANGRAVFVRVRAPHHALSSYGVTQVVVAAARRAGLGLIGAHRLRHTAAVQMLRAGASLPEIGQVLRHSRAMTTAIYAKADREMLRTLARPWPGGAA